MVKTLPERPDLAWLKKAAKEHLAVLRANDPGAKLHQAQLDIARDYASLVADEGVRENILGLIEAELARTKEMVLKVSGGTSIAERFPEFRAAIQSRLATINEVNREQVQLLRRFRGTEQESEREAFKSALLLSINTVAAGLGATG